MSPNLGCRDVARYVSTDWILKLEINKRLQISGNELIDD